MPQDLGVNGPPYGSLANVSIVGESVGHAEDFSTGFCKSAYEEIQVLLKAWSDSVIDCDSYLGMHRLAS